LSYFVLERPSLQLRKIIERRLAPEPAPVLAPVRTIRGDATA
jgi:hypothetical protein